MDACYHGNDDNGMMLSDGVTVRTVMMDDVIRTTVPARKRRSRPCFLLRMKVRLSAERITGSLYRRRPDMSTSAGMPAQPGCAPDAAKH